MLGRTLREAAADPVGERRLDQGLTARQDPDRADQIFEPDILAQVAAGTGPNAFEARYAGGTTPLQLAASLGRVDLLTLLLDHGAAINARADNGATALSSALRSKRTEAAARLHRRGDEG